MLEKEVSGFGRNGKQGFSEGVFQALPLLWGAFTRWGLHTDPGEDRHLRDACQYTSRNKRSGSRQQRQKLPHLFSHRRPVEACLPGEGKGDNSWRWDPPASHSNQTGKFMMAMIMLLGQQASSYIPGNFFQNLRYTPMRHRMMLSAP